MTPKHTRAIQLVAGNARLRSIAFLCAAFLLPKLSVAANYVAFNTLYSFNNPPAGADPHADLVAGPDGAFYGTTTTGGLYGLGVVFRITTGGNYSIVYSFGANHGTNGFPLDGANPGSALTLGNDGAFYGTADSGGISNAGVVFRMTTNGSFTTLYSFTNGVAPATLGSLILGTNGNFYGTSASGGTNGRGLAYVITPQGTFTPLYCFSNGPSYPEGLTLGIDGNFYGVTWGTNSAGPGTVFRMAPDGTIVYLHGFDIGDGDHPDAPLVLGSDGDFYGTTEQGGLNNDGVIFKISPDGAFTLLYSFTGGADGNGPEDRLVPSGDGGFYGTTFSGGDYSQGAVFELLANGDVSPIFEFSRAGPEGELPEAGLTLGIDGNFYGTATAGGTNGQGAIYKLTPGAGVTPFYSWPAPLRGAFPQGRLLLTGDGSLYGTLTYSNGAGSALQMSIGQGDGAVFKLAPDGSLTLLHSFTNGVDGSRPAAGLTLAPDGNVYGVTTHGGTYSNGTVFSITKDGTFSSLYSFTGEKDGAAPTGELVSDSTGLLYGTTLQGASGFGTVFTITTNGILTPLYAFSGAADGGSPFTGLTLGPDGNYYGTTSGVGTTNDGTIFCITTNGSLTTLHIFGGADGVSPFGQLTLGTDGNLYGTTEYGGAANAGVIFRIDTNGDFVVLYNMATGGDASSGGNCVGGLLQGTDGAFYGVASQLGISPDNNRPHPAEWNGDGTVFRITAGGEFSVLYSFGQILQSYPIDGQNPIAGLIQGPGGNLYGTTYLGGSADNGTLFRLTLPAPAAPVFQSISNSAEATSLTWSALWGAQYQLQYNNNLNSTAWANIGPIRTTTNSSLTASDTTATAQRFYRVYIPW